MPQETETRLEEWAALIGEDLSEEAESVAREKTNRSWRIGSEDRW